MPAAKVSGARCTCGGSLSAVFIHVHEHVVKRRGSKVGFSCHYRALAANWYEACKVLARYWYDTGTILARYQHDTGRILTDVAVHAGRAGEALGLILQERHVAERAAGAREFSGVARTLRTIVTNGTGLWILDTVRAERVVLDGAVTVVSLQAVVT